MKTKKIIKQVFITPFGLRESYGLIENGRPKRIFERQLKLYEFKREDNHG